MATNTSDNRYGPPTFIVDADISKATHTTIQGAIDDSSSGDTIYIHPGTYTEDLTLIAGINIYGVPTGNITSNAIIDGKVTQTATGTSGLANLRFISNSDDMLDFGGAGSIQTNFQHCSFFLDDGDCIVCNNASASPSFTECGFHQIGNTLDFWNITLGGEIRFKECAFFGPAGTPGTSTIAAGRIYFRNCNYASSQPLTTSATGNYFINYTTFGADSNTTFLTTAGTGTTELRYVSMDSGTSTAISIGAGTTVKGRALNIDTSNGTPIAITGTFDTSYNSY